jgi:hypothetical protein
LTNTKIDSAYGVEFFTRLFLEDRPDQRKSMEAHELQPWEDVSVLLFSPEVAAVPAVELSHVPISDIDIRRKPPGTG